MRLKETYHYGAFREEKSHPFSEVLTGSSSQAVYLHGTFKRTEQKMDVDGELRTIMAPNQGCFRMLRNIYTKIGEYAGKEEVAKVFRERYEMPQPLFTAFPKPALRYVRGLLEGGGRSCNVSIDDIGAEFIDPEGIQEPLHTLFMYRIVDSNYRIHYALSTSMAMLESKSNELHNAGEIEYSNDDMFWEDGFLVNEGNMKVFMHALMQDYFGLDPATPVTCIAHSPILRLNPNTVDFEPIGNATAQQLHDTNRNELIGMVMSVDEKYSMNSSLEQMLNILFE